MKLGKDFFLRDARQVACELLGKVLCRKQGSKVLRARIVETEAYFDEKDPASRACKNGNLKETMKMEGGTILTYGVHNNWLINFVTGKEGKAEAVLLRALEPLNFNGRCNGPGLLTKALSIKKDSHKKDVCDCEKMWVENGMDESFEIVKSKRIGVAKDLKEPLRFYIKDNQYISRK
jgi:DNA-3-methyladenine glycosylase